MPADDPPVWDAPRQAVVGDACRNWGEEDPHTEEEPLPDDPEPEEIAPDEVIAHEEDWMPTWAQEFAEEACGHPACAQEETCQGSPSDGLWRNYIRDVPGDLYCTTCWPVLVQGNPRLAGQAVLEVQPTSSTERL